jgi:hypothetical protein
MANKTQKIIMVVAVILTITAAFITGMEVQKAAGPVPADLVIVGVNENDEFIWSDIQPITQEHGARFSPQDGVTEYRLTYGH